MKRNFLLFFLFLKEFITSSTIKIIEEKKTLFEKSNDFHNDAIEFPAFYLEKMFRNNFYYSNNTSNSIYGLVPRNNPEEINYIQMYFSNKDTSEDFFLDNIIIKNEKFLSSLNNLKNNNVVVHNVKPNKSESIDLINFIENERRGLLKQRSLQTTINKCLEFTDCFNCTSYSDKIVDCIWFKGSCMNNTTPSRVKNWWNYFDNCLADYNSISIMNKYCGNLEFDTLPLSIVMNKIDNIYGTAYLFCSYTVNLNDPFKLVSINYTDTVIDSDSTFVLQVTYLDGSIINKTLPSKLEWILQGVISLKFHFFTRRSFTRLPFQIDISNETSSTNNYLGLFVSLGVVVFICLICSVCFYKCSRIIIENANRRLAQRRRLNLSRPNLNLMPNEEEDLRKTNQETLKKLLETDLKPMKYNEDINHFHTNCTICLEEFNNSMEVIFLFCKHIFHFECLKDWLEKNILLPKCPICNYNVLTGGVIDLHPNHNHQTNNNNNSGNVNFNNNQVINIHRNSNNSNQNINPSVVNNTGENNIIEMVQNNNENQRRIDNPNYIENKPETDEMNNRINTNLSSRNKENENININDNGYSRIDSNPSPNLNYNSNQSNKDIRKENNYYSKGFQNQIQLSSQEIPLNSVENINAHQEEIEIPNNEENYNSQGFLRLPPPNRPLSQTQNKQHNNFIIDRKNKLNRGLNNSQNSIIDSSKEKILTEESKGNN